MSNLRLVFLFLCIVLFVVFVFFIQNYQLIYHTITPILPHLLIREHGLDTELKNKPGLPNYGAFGRINTKLTTRKDEVTVSKPKSIPSYITPNVIASVSHQPDIFKNKLTTMDDSVSKDGSMGNHSVKTNPSTEISRNSEGVQGITGKESSKNFFHVSQWERLVKDVDCRALIRGDKAEQYRTANILKTEIVISKQGSDYINLTLNCERFKSSLGYITLPVNTEEEHFPLAFSILMFEDIEQSERLLRAIYRPHNLYCIHVDIKAKPDIKNGMKAIAECFDNVYIVPDPSDVQWGTFTILEPELKCLKFLWTKKQWKYFINLTGQEFPLKTNLELVRILQVYNGANNLEGTRKRANLYRWQNAGPPPHGIQPSKGSVHIVVSRGYVDYLLHNPVAQDLLEWVKNTDVPDETFFSTLNHNPRLGVPGSYMGEAETSSIYRFLTRYKAWHSGIFNLSCHGMYLRGVCIFGIEDLPQLTSVPHLFVNKFHWDYQHYTRDCLEEWYFNKTREELIHPSNPNLTFYKELSFVKLAVRPET